MERVYSEKPPSEITRWSQARQQVGEFGGGAGRSGMGFSGLGVVGLGCPELSDFGTCRWLESGFPSCFGLFEVIEHVWKSFVGDKTDT